MPLCALFSLPYNQRMFRLAAALAFALALILPGTAAFAQTSDNSPEPLRVTVTVNPDGSRTTYEWDNAHHRATATTSDRGKVREKIQYVLDDTGRFVTGEVFAPNGTLRFRTRYKYDAAGRLAEESQMAADGALRNRIVYAYDTGGRQLGYSIYDGDGKLVGRTGASRPPADASHSR